MRYLLSLRTIAIGAQVVALLLMYFSFSLHFPIWPVFLIISCLSVFTVVSLRRAHHQQKTSSGDIQKQLIVDVIALTLLVYFTGGSTNPFIFFFLLPIVFAAATLNFKQTCLISGLAMISYTALMFFHIPILQHSHHQQGFNLHIWGMWYGFLISSGLLTYYVSRIGISIRKRDRALARAREENLKADQILALGTLAAGTAHELGTPLSTMAVLARELEHEHADNPSLSEDLQILREQIDRCKTILSRMAIDAGQSQAHAGHLMALDIYLQQLVKEWHQSRPDTGFKYHSEGIEPTPEIIAETTLGQTIHNVLNNAANACESVVECESVWDETNLTLRVLDDGPGFNAAQDSASGGLGIGLFLSRITLNRLGGELRLQNRSDNKPGTEAIINLPLQAIRLST